MNKKLSLIITLGLALILAMTASTGCGTPDSRKVRIDSAGTNGFEGPQQLTYTQKQRVVEIILDTNEAKQHPPTETIYDTRLRWTAFIWDDSGYSYMSSVPIENWEADPSYKSIPESARWYPGAAIRFGDPPDKSTYWSIQANVDLEANKVVYISSMPYGGELLPAPTPVPTPTPAPGPAPGPGISLGVRFDRVPDVVASYGEKAKINLSFTNAASETRTISPFPPEIRIIELPNLRPPDRVVRAFPVGKDELALQPGESVSHSVDWDQKNDSGEQVPPGWYSVEVTLATSRGSATRVLVLPPEGVMEKTIEVNQSKTVNGITITLEKVELTAIGMKVYAFNIPPDYNLPRGPMLAPPEFMALHAFAEYGVNGGVMKQTFPSAIRFLDNGMLHTWDEYLDPVPKNAKELTFRITKLGDWEGPWEFKIPLE